MCTALVLTLATTVGSRGGEPMAGDAFGISAGDALSRRALVQKPAPVQDLLSWTIESKRHRGHLYMTAVSPDGKRVGTGGLDGVIRIWDADTGEFLRALVGHNSYIFGLAWSPDGKLLASAGSHDATVRLWNAATGMPLRVLKGHKGYTNQVAWSADGKNLAVSGGSSGFVTHWRINQSAPVKTIEVGTPVSALSWAADGVRVAVASSTDGVALWDTQTNQVGPLATGLLKALHLAWSPDGKTLAVTGVGKTVLWDDAANKIRQSADISGAALAWSPDGKQLAIASGAQVQVRSADLAAKPSVVHYGAAANNRLAWRRPEQIVAGSLHSVALLVPDQPKQARVLKVAESSNMDCTPQRPVISGLQTNEPILWETNTGKRIGPLKGHTGLVHAASWSRDGKTLATASADKTIRLWDPTGKALATLSGHEGAVQCLSWASAKTLASGGADATVRLWTIGSDAPPRLLEGHDGPISTLAWSREGTLLASGSSNGGTGSKVYVWNANGIKQGGTIKPGGIPRSLAWSPGAKFLAVGLESTKTYFYTPQGKELGFFELGGSPPAYNSLAWTNDGQVLVAGRANHTVQAIRPGVAKPILNISVMSPVTQVAVTSDGFVVAGTDRAGRWHDGATGQLRLTYLVDEQQACLVSTHGHFRCPDPASCELVYVAQTPRSQITLDPKEFAAQFKWKNNPALAQPPLK
jgi:WD40 repeat protein